MADVALRGSSDTLSVGKIVCVGRNYALHIKEMGGEPEAKPEPVFFLKPSTALINDGGSIRYPGFSSELHYELELVLLIGRGGRDIPASRATDHIAGVGVGLDLTARDVQRHAMERGMPWAVSKGFDDSAPVSQFAPLRPGLNPDALTMILKVNGEVRQRGNTAEMIHNCAELVSGASRYFTLERGDLLFTGTPEGVGPLRRGDRLTLELDGLVSARFTILDPAACRLSGA